MTVAQLLALSVGQRIHWDYPTGPAGGTVGTVTARDGDELSITWDDGQEAGVAPYDDDLVEFAGWLACVDDADEPVIIDRRHERSQPTLRSANLNR